MTRFWLIRHGSHDWLGKTMVGRKSGIPLNARGHEEAANIAQALRVVPLAAVYSSPLERTLQTAAPLAAQHGLAVPHDETLIEVDFGDWTGRTFDELATDPRWEQWNRARATSTAPGGESMHAVQRRILSALDRLAGAHPRADVALFSHGDVIRAALAHALGLSLDLIHTIDFGPGAVAVLDHDPDFTQLMALCSNQLLRASTPFPSLFPPGSQRYLATDYREGRTCLP